MAMTIKDIAKWSGYSVGTVSRVLNNHPDVSQKARDRVMAVVAEHDFEPNVNAKHLKMRARSSIAILVKGTQNLLFADLLEKVQALLAENGEEAFTAYLDEDDNEVSSAIQLYRERRPKAYIFLGGDLEFFRREFSRIKVPSVLLTNCAKDLGFQNLSSFTTDDRAASEEVVDYLVERGHRHIGVVGGNFSFEQVSFRRLEGVEERLREHGLTFDGKTQHQPCRFSMSDGYDAAKQLLTRNHEITALFALSDVIALGALRAICDLGMRVPDDISLIGYDGIATSQYSVPRLTTVYQDTGKLARRGVETLLQRLHYDAPPLHEIVPFKLITRESVRSLKD